MSPGHPQAIGKAFAGHLAADGYDLIVVGRREDRLAALAASLPDVAVQVVAADLAADVRTGTVAGRCAGPPLTMLASNAGVARYLSMAELPADKARELVHVKVVASAMLTRAALAGMIARGAGMIINVAGMIAFSGPAPAAAPQGQRAVYAGMLAGTVAMSQTLHAERDGTGVNVHVICPGLVATEFHQVQGMDLPAIPRMPAEDVVAAALSSIELGEVVSAPGIEDYGLLQAVFAADRAAFHGQSPSSRLVTWRAEPAHDRTRTGMASQPTAGNAVLGSGEHRLPMALAIAEAGYSLACPATSSRRPTRRGWLVSVQAGQFRQGAEHAVGHPHAHWPCAVPGRGSSIGWL